MKLTLVTGLFQLEWGYYWPVWLVMWHDVGYPFLGHTLSDWNWWSFRILFSNLSSQCKQNETSTTLLYRYKLSINWIGRMSVFIWRCYCVQYSDIHIPAKCKALCTPLFWVSSFTSSNFVKVDRHIPLEGIYACCIREYCSSISNSSLLFTVPTDVAIKAQWLWLDSLPNFQSYNESWTHIQ